MESSQGRRWRVLIIGVLALAVGCQEPAQRTSPGALPRPPVGSIEPRINATTYFAHGHLLERQGQFERAVVQYRKALRLRPQFLSARNRLGITLNKLGRHFEASDEFRRAIADYPNLAYLHNNLGFSLYLEERYAEAEAALQRALELKPDFARAHMNRALVLARLERFDEAYSELLAAGNEADACFNMGMILTEAGRYAEAAQYLETALALRPDFEAARRQLRSVARLAAAVAQTSQPPAPVAEQHTRTAAGDAALAMAAGTPVETPPAEQPTAPGIEAADTTTAPEPPPSADESVPADVGSEQPEPSADTDATGPVEAEAALAQPSAEPTVAAAAQAPVVVAADVEAPREAVDAGQYVHASGFDPLAALEPLLRPCVDLEALLDAFSLVLGPRLDRMIPFDHASAIRETQPVDGPAWLSRLGAGLLAALRDPAASVRELWHQLGSYLSSEPHEQQSGRPVPDHASPACY